MKSDQDKPKRWRPKRVAIVMIVGVVGAIILLATLAFEKLGLLPHYFALVLGVVALTAFLVIASRAAE